MRTRSKRGEAISHGSARGNVFKNGKRKRTTRKGADYHEQTDDYRKPDS